VRVVDGTNEGQVILLFITGPPVPWGGFVLCKGLASRLIPDPLHTGQLWCLDTNIEKGYSRQSKQQTTKHQTVTFTRTKYRSGREGNPLKAKTIYKVSHCILKYNVSSWLVLLRSSGDLPGRANASPIPPQTPVVRLTCLKHLNTSKRGNSQCQLPYLSACPIEIGASRMEQSQLLHLTKILMAQQPSLPLSYHSPCDDYLSLPNQSCRQSQAATLLQ